MVSHAIALYGTEQATAPLRTVLAGPLKAEFDNGALRYIRFGGVEMLRAIAFLVRDENWGTFSPEISHLTIDEGEDAFLIRYRGRCVDATRKLVYEATISGQSDGSLSFEAVAEPKTDILTNRTGFIVLHPIESVAGRTVKVLHVDGSEEHSTFPETIDPRCPFRDVRALSHEIAPGTWATCTMEGDAFETEDQRNWSDASYKTYIRPLTKPWPYTLQKDEKIFQSVKLSISGSLPQTANSADEGPITVSVGREIGKLPEIGVGVPADEASHALANADLVKRLSARWLICQVDLRRGHGRAELERYRALGKLTGAEVMLEIVTQGTMDPLAELTPVAQAAADAGLKPAAIAVFPAQDMVSVQPDAPWPEMPSFEATYAAAREAFAGVKMGGGMAAYFTELNRKRPPSALLDFVTHTTCPNVHAADDRSVMETNEAIPFQILTTRSFMGDLPYRIGPSQLACRENPYGPTTAPNAGNSRVCLSLFDPRQRGIYNAAWMIAYVAACARGGVDAVALGAPTGPMGHIYRALDFPQPYFDNETTATIYPGFHVIAGLAQLSGKPIQETNVSARGKIEAIAIPHENSTVLWLANLTGDVAEVKLPALFEGSSLVVLDTEAFERLTALPDYLEIAGRKIRDTSVRLDAYAVARIVSN